MGLRVKGFHPIFPAARFSGHERDSFPRRLILLFERLDPVVMRLFFLLLVLLPCAAAIVPAQSLSVVDIDATGFPVMKAKLSAFDAAGDPVRPSASEVTVSEGGRGRSVVSISCPPTPPPLALSSVLVVDVSGSMKEMTGGVRRIDLAKAATGAWIQGLPAGASECAVTSFDESNYLNQDFTTDRTRLLNAVSALSPGGGTDYDEGLLLAASGGLRISRNGKYRKVIVFLTDGLPASTPQTSAIIAEAQRQNCVIFAVTLSMFCPQSLRDIAAGSGGGWFENVSTVSQAEEIYRGILRQMRGSVPCDISWRSAVGCAGGDQEVTFNWNGRQAKGTYRIPASGVAKLDIVPPILNIRSKPTGVRFDTTITITAVNAPFNVTGITSSDPAYEMNPKSFTLAAGESRVVTVSYTPTDSSYSWARFDIATDLCPRLFFSSGSYPGRKVTRPTLRLDSPNGGEVFVGGSDTVITWSGISPDDTVTLEYSIDNGATWKEITRSATGGRYPWHVPGTPSTRCLVRVTQPDQGGGWVIHGRGPYSDNGNDMALDAAGNMYIVGGYQQAIDFGGGLVLNGAVNESCAFLAKVRPDGTIDWARRVGAGGTIHTIQIDLDPAGEIYISGAFSGSVYFGTQPVISQGKMDAYIARYTPDGSVDFVWGAGTRDDDFIISLVIDHVGNLYISGNYRGSMDLGGVTIQNFGLTASFIARLTPDGRTVWVDSIKGERQGEAPQLAVDGSGGLYLTGGFGSDITIGTSSFTSAGNNDIYFAKYDVDGSFLWARSAGGVDSDVPRALTVDSWGNIYVGGYFHRTLSIDDKSVTSAGRWDMFLAKFHSDGSIEWLRGMGGKSTEGVGQIATDNIGNLYVIGYISDTTDLGGTTIISKGSEDVFIAKYASDSRLEWVRQVNGTGLDLAGKLVVDDLGSITVIGAFGGQASFGRHQRIAAGQIDVFVWRIGEDLPLQSDTSDALFSIVIPAPAAVDVDMGKVMVGGARDSVVASFVRNTGTHPFRVDKIGMTGSGASLFSIVSGHPPFVVPPGGAVPVEFRFGPTAVGTRSAQLRVITQNDTLLQIIRGEGVAPALEVLGGVIDFGQVGLGGSRDSIRAVTVRNIGSAPLSISRTRHGGPNAVDFTTLAGGGPLTLQPGDTARIDLRFTPSATGRTSGELLVDYNGAGSPAAITLFGEGVDGSIVPVNRSIDFGRVDLGESRDTIQAVTITNIGAHPVVITGTRHAGPNRGDFTTISGGGGRTLGPGDTVKVDLRYTPSSAGAAVGQLLFDYEGVGGPVAVQLYGEGVAKAEPPGAAEAELEAGYAEAAPGDTVEIPIVVSKTRNIATSGATEYRVTLRYNATLLAPVGATPRGRVDGLERVIDLTMPAKADSGEVLRLRFLAMLGDDTTTTLSLEEASAEGGEVRMRSRAGEFRLKGVCISGGARLVHPTAKGGLKSVYPNPAKEEMEVDLETIEEGYVNLYLADATGRKVKEIVEGEQAASHQVLRVQTGDLPAGRYLLVLETATMKRSLPVEIRW